MTLLTNLLKIERHVGVWFIIFMLTTASIVLALYYQYGLELEPCVLCIHIRIIMIGLMLLSFFMIFLTKYTPVRFIGNIVQSALALQLFLTSRTLYRIEMGLEEAGCMFSANLPEWFDLEDWLPSIFQVRSACGETPELFLNITMADALYYGSAVAFFMSVLLLSLSLIGLIKNRSEVL
jgi:disulfide bond formation protein DsbB